MSVPDLSFPTVRVSRKGADRVLSGHLWIYSSDVTEAGAAEPGSVVKVAAPGGRTLGVAHFSSTSQISLRMLSPRVEAVDKPFYLGRLRAALEHRRRVVTDSEGYRLVHSEGDLLPGLVVDRYGDYLVVQALNQGMDRALGVILECLCELLHPKGIVLRNDAAVRAHESLPLEKRVAAGDVPERVPFRMNSLEWEADLTGGQKTGVYLDQRENYLAAARYAHGRALDAFTSTGGFGLHLAAHCEDVEAVDSSAVALTTAAANRDRNGIGNVEFREANVFDLLASYNSAGRRFGTVVLDPPAFAKSRANLESAGRGYKEINLRGLRLLDRGGILVTCSCSHHFGEAMLLETVAAAALDAGKTLRVLDRRAQSQDHPILLTVPETLYLKCLILQVL